MSGVENAVADLPDGAVARAAARDGARVNRWRWIAIALLLVGATINIMDRASLAVANPLIQRDLGLSLTEMGLLLGMFNWAYGLAQIPAAFFVDRWGARRMLSASMCLWSVVQAGCGLATGFVSFTWLRLALGLCEAPVFLIDKNVIKRWFSAEERGLPVSMTSCATPLANVLAPPVVTLLMLSFSWRWMFVILGLAGIFLAAIWYAFYRDPGPTGPPRDDAEDANKKLALGDWLKLLRSGTAWALMLGYCGSGYASALIQAWLPGYLVLEQHLSIAHTGLVAAIPFIAGVLGASLSWVGDLLIRRGWQPIPARKIVVVAGTIGIVASLVPTAYAGTTLMAVIGLSATTFFTFFTRASAWVVAVEVAPTAGVASIAGMMNTAIIPTGVLAPFLTGLIVQQTGSFAAAFLLAAGIVGATALVWTFAIKRHIEVT